MLLVMTARAALPTPSTITVMVDTNGVITAPTNFWLMNRSNVNYAPGENAQVLFNNASALGTDPGFEYVKDTDALWVPNVNISLTGRFNFLFVTNTILADASPETPAIGFQLFSKDVGGVSQPWILDKAGTERRILVDHSSQYARDVWIAVRTDGLPGSGIETDPYDGSTRTKFDAVMNTLRTDGLNQNIRLFPGTFFTQGSQGWSALAIGDSLYGAGIQKTILVGTNFTDTVDHAAMVNCNYEGGLPGRVIRDLTIDCNQPEKLGGKITGISIWKAKDVLVENVEVLRLGGTTTNYESFGICLMQVTNAVVNNCIVQSNTSGYIGAIGVGGQNCTVSKCSVKFNTDVTDKRLAAYGMSGSPSSDLRFIGNYCTNALYGWWCDTGDTIDNIQFLDNTIHTTGINGGGGVSVYLYCGAAGPYYSNVSIRNNLFSGSATNHGIYLGMGSYGFFNGVWIEGNEFTCGVPTSDTYGLSLRQATNVFVGNNVFSENLHHFSFLTCQGLCGFQNRTPAGNPSPTLNIPYLPIEAGANVVLTTNGLNVKITASASASAVQSLTTATAIVANAPIVRVVGSGGAVTLTATPTLADGVDAQEIEIWGTNDTNTVAIQDEGTLTGSNIQLPGTVRTLGLGDVMILRFNSTTGFWYETGFSNN